MIAELVRRIMGYAVGATKSLVPDTSPRALPVLFDHIFFNYQWVDRVASKVLGAGRPSFMDALRDALRIEMKTAVYSHLEPAQQQRAVTNLDPLLDSFMVEFSRYGTPSWGDSGVAGTLSYEFGKKVANKLGRAEDAFVIAGIASNAAAGLKEIDAPTLLRAIVQ